MSIAAETYVESFSHPKAKGLAALTLFKVLAQLVPEGQTTTPQIGMGALATLAQLDRRTVWRWLKVLVEIGEVRVVDGMPGRSARYTLVHVSGADPIEEAPLPLVGATPRRSRPRRASGDTTPDLFESPEGEEPAIIRSQGSQVDTITWITWITGYVTAAITWITGYTGFAITGITGYTGSRAATCDPCDLPALPLAVDDDARAGAIRKSPYVHTHVHTALRDAPPEANEESPPPLHPWHAWCEGLVHVPKVLHTEWLRKHSEAELFAFYARRAGVVVASEDLSKNEIQIWRRRYGEDEAFRAQSARGQPAHPPVSIPLDLYAQGEADHQRRRGGSR